MITLYTIYVHLDNTITNSILKKGAVHCKYIWPIIFD